MANPLRSFANLLTETLVVLKMNDFWLSYSSWRFTWSPLNKMLHCGTNYNDWVGIALNYLPEEIFSKLEEKIAFYSTAERDACRIARHICETRKIILLSEHILPKKGTSEEKSEVRYFIFAVLHEIAHALKKHRSPLYDKLTQEESDAQEKEADELALNWYNGFITKRNNPHLMPLTFKEVDEIRNKNQKLMKANYENV